MKPLPPYLSLHSNIPLRYIEKVYDFTTDQIWQIHTDIKCDTTDQENFNSAQLSQQLKPDPSQQLKSAFPAFDFNSAEGKGPDSFLNVALSEAFNLNDVIKTIG